MTPYATITLKVKGSEITVPFYFGEDHKIFCELPECLLSGLEWRRFADENKVFTGKCVPFVNKAGKWCLQSNELKDLQVFLYRARLQQRLPKDKPVRLIAYYIEKLGNFSYDQYGETAASGKKAFESNNLPCTVIGLHIAVKVVELAAQAAGQAMEESCSNSEDEPSSEDLAAKINAWGTWPDLDSCDMVEYSDEAARYFLSLLETTSEFMLHLNDDEFNLRYEPENFDWEL